MAGEIADGVTLYNPGGDNMRPAGLFTLQGQEPTKISSAGAGDTIALGRLEDVATGDTLSVEKGTVAHLAPLEMPTPVYGLCVEAADRKDEVKLSTSLSKIIDEDPSLVLEHNQHTNEMVLWGHGEIHLRVALERLAGKYGIKDLSTGEQTSGDLPDLLRKVGGG